MDFHYGRDAVGTESGEHLHSLPKYYDIVKFSTDIIKDNLTEFHEIYLKGRSLREISVEKGIPKNTLRKAFLKANLPLRLGTSIRKTS